MSISQPTVQFQYGAVNSASTTPLIIPVNRTAKKRVIVLVNKTDQSLSNITVSAYDSTLPTATKAAASDTDTITGALAASDYAVLVGENHPSVGVIGLNQLVLSVTAGTAATTGTLDVYVIESSAL